MKRTWTRASVSSASTFFGSRRRIIVVARSISRGSRSIQYGNAIHWANIALGQAALARDRLAAASEYLVRAGKTPGSPQLNSFGPDRDLARALLERGERTAVLTYLADCARFWEGNEALLETWRTTIERGEPTQLERSYDSDDD